MDKNKIEMRKSQAGLMDPAPTQVSSFYGPRVIHPPGGTILASAPSHISPSLSAWCFWIQNDTLMGRDHWSSYKEEPIWVQIINWSFLHDKFCEENAQSQHHRTGKGLRHVGRLRGRGSMNGAHQIIGWL